MGEWLERLTKDRRGATMIEYALLAAIIGLACISSFSYFVKTTNRAWTDTANAVSTSAENAAADLD